MSTNYHTESIRRIVIFIRAALSVSVEIQTYKPLIAILEERYQIKFTDDVLEQINLGISLRDLAEIVSCLVQRKHIQLPDPEVELHQPVFVPTKYWYAKSFIIKVEPLYLSEPESFSKYLYYTCHKHSPAMLNRDIFKSRLAAVKSAIKHRLGI